MLSRDEGYVIVCSGRAFGDCTRLIMGHLGKEPKMKEVMDLGDLGRIKCGKVEVKEAGHL